MRFLKMNKGASELHYILLAKQNIPMNYCEIDAYLSEESNVNSLMQMGIPSTLVEADTIFGHLITL